MSTTPEYWKKCNSCKSPIGFDQLYWVCSVSTCNRARTGLVFCKVSCFDAHVPMMNHRDAGALEKRAPSLHEWLGQQAAEAAAEAREVARNNNGEPRPPAGAGQPGPTPIVATGESRRDILVVVSKTKDYVRATSGFNTSDAVMEVLSDRLRVLLDDAIRRAAQDGRKTVLDRDFR